MKWPDVVFALIRCELKARSSGFGSWQLSAKGALPIVLLIVALVTVWGGN